VVEFGVPWCYSITKILEKNAAGIGRIRREVSYTMMWTEKGKRQKYIPR